MALIIDGEAGAAPMGAGDLVKDTDTANFVRDVIEESVNVPVIVDFWAPWCGPCKTLGPLLEKCVAQAGGLVRMVKVNVDENQDLAMQMRVQSVPAVYAFKDGKPVDAFVGAQPESQIRAFIDRLTGGAATPGEMLMEEAQAAFDAGDYATAGAIYAQILTQMPEDTDAIAGAIRTAVAAGDVKGARQAVNSLPDAMKLDAAVQAAISSLELAEQGGGDIDAAKAKVDADPDDHQARLDLAQGLYAMGRAEEAVEELLEQIKRDRAWNDEAGRVQLVKIFDALGHSHPLTMSARRRLSSLLFS